VKKHIILAITVIVSLAMASPISYIYAEDSSSKDANTKNTAEKEGEEYKAYDAHWGGKFCGMSREELKTLKEKDPEKFKEVISEKRQEIKKRLERLKQSDPEKYRAVKQKIKERRRERLEKLKTENPEKYKEVMERHKQRAKDRLEDTDEGKL